MALITAPVAEVYFMRVPFPESSPRFSISVSNIGPRFKRHCPGQLRRGPTSLAAGKRIGTVVGALRMVTSCLRDKKLRR